VGEFRMSVPAAKRGKTFVGNQWWPNMEYLLKFERHYGRYFLTVFVPLWMVQSLSLMSHFIDPTAVPARVGLGVTTVLVYVSLMITLTRDVPAVGETYAIDFYFLLCFMFVTAANFEYAIINYVLTRLRLSTEKMTRREALDHHLREKAAEHGREPTSSWSSPTRSVPGDMMLLSEHEGNKKLHEDQWQEALLREMFELFDVDRSETISLAELKPILAAAGLPNTHSDIRALVRAELGDTVAELDLQQFVTMLRPHTQELFKEFRTGLALIWGTVWTRRDVAQFESRYRIIAAFIAVTFNVVWFALTISLGGDNG